MLEISLKALARYASIFESEGFCWGHWNGEPGAVPYFAYSDAASAFVDDAYQHNWVLKGFNWSDWIGGGEADRLRTMSGAIEAATAEQLGKLLTCYVRGERFREGALAEAYEAGYLTRIARRAAVLVNTE